MWHSLAPYAFTAVLVVACIIALIRGGPRERLGALIFAAAYVASVAAQQIDIGYTPTLKLAIIDGLLLLALMRLAWKAPRAWPAIAAGLQGLAMAAHALYALKVELRQSAYLNVLAIVSYAELAALVWGSLSRRTSAPRSSPPAP